MATRKRTAESTESTKARPANGRRRRHRKPLTNPRATLAERIRQLIARIERAEEILDALGLD